MWTVTDRVLTKILDSKSLGKFPWLKLLWTVMNSAMKVTLLWFHGERKKDCCLIAFLDCFMCRLLGGFKPRWTWFKSYGQKPYLWVKQFLVSSMNLSSEFLNLRVVVEQLLAILPPPKFIIGINSRIDLCRLYSL